MNSLYSLKETANNVCGNQTTAIRIITNIKSKNMNHSQNTISDNYKELQPHQTNLSSPCPDIRAHVFIQHSYLIYFSSWGNLNKLLQETIMPHVTLSPPLLSDLPSRLSCTYPQQPFSVLPTE